MILDKTLYCYFIYLIILIIDLLYKLITIAFNIIII